MKARASVSLYLLFTALLAGCASSRPVADHAADLRLAALGYERAVHDKDAPAAARFFREDVVSISPQSPQPVLGVEANRAAWERFFARPKAAHSMTIDQVLVDPSGVLGYTLGDWSAAMEIQGKLIEGSGRYVAVWRLTEGEWRIAVIAAHRLQ